MANADIKGITITKTDNGKFIVVVQHMQLNEVFAFTFDELMDLMQRSFGDDSQLWVPKPKRTT